MNRLDEFSFGTNIAEDSVSDYVEDNNHFKISIESNCRVKLYDLKSDDEEESYITSVY